MFVVTFNVDSTKARKIIAYNMRQDTKNFLAEAVKEMGGELMVQIYEPTRMPWDLGRARAGASRGFAATGRNYVHIGYQRGYAEGHALSRARLTRTTFKSDNLVPYAGILDQHHRGRQQAMRYTPTRGVLATGPYRNFVPIGFRIAMDKSDRIMTRLLRKHFKTVTVI